MLENRICLTVRGHRGLYCTWYEQWWNKHKAGSKSKTKVSNLGYTRLYSSGLWCIHPCWRSSSQVMQRWIFGTETGFRIAYKHPHDPSGSMVQFERRCICYNSIRVCKWRDRNGLEMSTCKVQNANDIASWQSVLHMAPESGVNRRLFWWRWWGSITCGLFVSLGLKTSIKLRCIENLTFLVLAYYTTRAEKEASLNNF